MKSSENSSVDTNKYVALLAEADRAYRSDVSYAIAACGAARSIESKREVWKLRLELREAAKKAQKRCVRVLPFKCGNVSPCGLGECRFAEGDMVFLTLESPGNTIRPQVDSMPSYGLEGAVESLRQLRASTSQPS